MEIFQKKKRKKEIKIKKKKKKVFAGADRLVFDDAHGMQDPYGFRFTDREMFSFTAEYKRKLDTLHAYILHKVLPSISQLTTHLVLGKHGNQFL